LSQRGRPWQPGESGNPAGRPIGSRQKVSEAIIRDISDAWATHGRTVLDKLAVSDPGKFAQLAAGLIPREFQLSVESRLPGGLTSEDMEIFQAIKQALPDAGSRQPGEVLLFVADAIRAHGAKPIEAHTESPLNGTGEKPA
jgi:hypothetical protein